MDIWDLHQESRIRETTSDARETSQKGNRAHDNLDG